MTAYVWRATRHELTAVSEPTAENARGARVPPGGAGAPAHASCRKDLIFNFFTAPLGRGEPIFLGCFRFSRLPFANSERWNVRQGLLENQSQEDDAFFMVLFLFRVQFYEPALLGSPLTGD